jgi:RNA polymerase sigma-70 factor (ECF subfamily)
MFSNLEQVNEKQNFSTWLFSIAHNLCKNEFRRIDTRQTDLRDDMDEMRHPENNNPNPLENLEKKEFKMEINSILEKLDNHHRSVFILRFQEELSIQEIAEIMHCAEGTVKSRLHYAIKKISTYLFKKYPNPSEV